MAVNLSPLGGAAQQFFDNSGNILSGGLIYTYTAGTTTPQATYTSSTGATPHANPIVLDSAGRVPGGEIWVTAGVTYKFVIYTAASVLLGSYDNLIGVNQAQSAADVALLPSGYVGSTNVQTAFNVLGSSAGSSTVGFINAGTGATSRTTQSKLRDTVSVKDYGATGDGVTNDTAAIQAAITANPGKIIFFPSGSYTFTQLTITSNSTTLLGEAAMTGGTVLIPRNTTGNDIVFDGCQHSQMENFQIQPSVKKTSGYAVYFTNNAYVCKAINVRVDYCFNGFAIFNATQCEIIDCQCRYMIGVDGIYFGGTTGSYRGVINNFSADNPYPGAVNTSQVKTYAASTAFSVNDIAVSNSKIWQCTQAGTTASGAGPSGYPGTTGPTVFTTTVTSGTTKWKFVCDVSLTWIHQDSYGYSLVIDKAALLNGARGFGMTDVTNSGTSYPKWAFTWDLELDHNYFGGAMLEGGEGAYINGGWIGSCLSSNGVLIANTFRSEVFIGSGTRIVGNAESGILLQPGPSSVIIDGCMIGYNSQKTVGTYHGINVAAGSTDFIISNNRIGDLRDDGGSGQNSGIFLAAGATNKFIITGNNLLGNAYSGPLYDGATGTSKRIANNLGANPGLLATVTVGASPFTWTNNTGNTASLLIQNGTVTYVKLDGYRVNVSTYIQVVVPQGSSVETSYTVAPTMLQQSF